MLHCGPLSRKAGRSSVYSAVAASAIPASGRRWAASRPSGPIVIIVTDDNPRGEDPAAIAAAVVDGIRAAGRTNFTIELDRGAAIRAAVAGAGAGDVVLVAGKGHEDYQERNGERTPFSDVDTAAAALRRWSGE